MVLRCHRGLYKRPSSKSIDILNTLCQDKRNLVFIVSAKSREREIETKCKCKFPLMSKAFNLQMGFFLLTFDIRLRNESNFFLALATSS